MISSLNDPRYPSVDSKETKNNNDDSFALLDALDFGAEVIAIETETKADSRSRPQRTIRRSRSASNLTQDAQIVFGKLLPFIEVDDEDEDDNDFDLFEPLPITHSSSNFDAYPELMTSFGNSNNSNCNMLDCHELNNRKPKRGRRRSLLRRSNSFESVFDHKKKTAFDVSNFDFQDNMFSSKREPSLMNTNNGSFASTHIHNIDPVWSSPAFLQPAVQDANGDGCPNTNNNFSFASYSTHNNRHDTTIDPVEAWPSPVIVQRVAVNDATANASQSQKLTSQSLLAATVTIDPPFQARTAQHRTGNYFERSDFPRFVSVSSSSTSNDFDDHDTKWVTRTTSTTNATAKTTTTTQKVTNPLLAAAPPLPEFLKAAANDILGSADKSNADDMTARERQAAAIDALKERKRNRQLAKQKSSRNKD